VGVVQKINRCQIESWPLKRSLKSQRSREGNHGSPYTEQNATQQASKPLRAGRDKEAYCLEAHAPDYHFFATYRLFSITFLSSNEWLLFLQANLPGADLLRLKAGQGVNSPDLLSFPNQLFQSR
jgi:hypothetical protein